MKRLAMLLTLGLVSGCDPAPGVTDVPRANWSRQRMADADGGRAFDAAQYALRQWFTIDVADRSEGLLTTVPAEYDERGGTGRIRDTAIKYPNRMRRRATVRVQGDGAEVSVDCVVIRERLDTADMRVFRLNRQFDDVGNETPIEQEAGSSAGQNEVWTDVGRDRSLERQILDVVRERLGSQTQPAAAGAGV
jgi:hypothetical protein